MKGTEKTYGGLRWGTSRFGASPGGVERRRPRFDDDAEEHSVENAAMSGNEVAATSTHDTAITGVQRIDVGGFLLQVLVVVVHGRNRGDIDKTAGSAHDHTDVGARNVSSAHVHDVADNEVGRVDSHVLLVPNHDGGVPHLVDNVGPPSLLRHEGGGEQRGVFGKTGEIVHDGRPLLSFSGARGGAEAGAKIHAHVSREFVEWNEVLRVV